ncbi:HK97-gp10 family putative phage morphogenesis protein [uncultured Pseudacidovorax sp.]|uniref:HK97-gp10 family putative phage morphogenesis protein n=1 Tax=uncultured Pseudacidovorax sp. TaxID=679313 RepID=UPI0025D2DA93|nr:HK97-gp10 family putative phage morphogenesis protein [uncultured Pseudacidovorax sp.]
MADLSIQADLSDLEDDFDLIVEDAAAAVRPSAQAAAQVLYDEVLVRVPVSKKGHWFYGTSAKKAPPGQKRSFAYWFESGSLQRSIYQAYSQDNSGPARATYHISWRQADAPYAFMVEFGTATAPAHPFLRPSWDAKNVAATDAMWEKFRELMKGAMA